LRVTPAADPGWQRKPAGILAPSIPTLASNKLSHSVQTRLTLSHNVLILHVMMVIDV
jgi:hypothetical protein